MIRSQRRGAAIDQGHGHGAGRCGPAKECRVPGACGGLVDRPYGERKAGGSVRVRTVEEVGRSSRCCKVCWLAGRTLVDEHFPEMCCQIFTSSDFAAMPCDLLPADFKQTDSPPRVFFSVVGAPKVVLCGGAFCPSYHQASAIAAIDTLNPGIFTGSLAPCRAGGSVGNHRSHSSFIPEKSSSSASTTVALTILSSELPASARIAAIFSRHCRVCS